MEPGTRRRELLTYELELHKVITEAGRPAILDAMVRGARAALVAELEIDSCNIMSDYFATKTDARYVIAWSRKDRNDFKEMRIAAARCHIPQVQELMDAGPAAEHRDTHSMGKGLYLKNGGPYDTGWLVRKYS